jgi:hypothetical protein
MIVMSKDALKSMLQAYMDNRDTLRVKLFKNDYTPGANTTAANFDEATFPGYDSLHASQLGEVAFDPTTGKERQVFDAVTFTRTAGTGSETIYGYWMESDNLDLEWCERFTSPVTMAVAGDSFTLSLQLAAWSYPTT